VLDAELGERPPDLGEHVLGDLAARRRCVEVVAAAVGVERAGQAVRGDRRGEPRKLDMQ
jgi:hypothetical protein